jgi:hypothetical protein
MDRNKKYADLCVLYGNYIKIGWMQKASNSISSFSGNFLETFNQLLSPSALQKLLEGEKLPLPRGVEPKLSLWEWVAARVYHAGATYGTFADNVKTLLNIKISNSAMSQRYPRVGWQLFAKVFQSLLHPLADPQAHPSAFYKGLRLTALDGYSINVRNTLAINDKIPKTRCSKGNGQPAFARQNSVVLIELGTHQPLAASIGWQGEGELTLARAVCKFRYIPDECLLIADRLYGNSAMLRELLPVLRKKGSHCLLRVKSNIGVRELQTLADGSKLVSVTIYEPGSRRVAGHVTLRQIHATIHVQGRKEKYHIRLWTSLLDPTTYPALELVELYAKRWEVELFFRELKINLHRGNNLLDAQTPESAAIEMLALLCAASLIARQRVAVAAHAGTDTLAISFAHVHESSLFYFKIMALAGDILTKDQIHKLQKRILANLAQTALITKRKTPRSCQRALRQPSKDWPKMHHPSSRPLIKSIFITPESYP